MNIIAKVFVSVDKDVKIYGVSNKAEKLQAE